MNGNAEKPAGGLGLLLRHQAGALIATAVDFAVFFCLVNGAGMQPVPATAVGAGCGALINFWLSRRFIFDARQAGIGGQSLRYLVVSGASLGWNTGGEWLFAVAIGLHYMVARVIVSVLVSVAWNYPMHRFYVFPTND